MSDPQVDYALEASVAGIRLDDGKANALSHAVLDGLLAALGRADEDEARAIVLVASRTSAGPRNREPTGRSSR